MQYSPDCTIPYLSRVDAGTVELVRSCGVEVVTSADLVSRFEAVLDAAGWESHKQAGDRMHAVLGETWAEIARRLKAGEACTENGIQQFMLQRYAHHGLDCEGQFPIVAVNAHAGDPHFDPTPEASVDIKDGDAILIDLWAKLAQPGAIYYDITWCGIIGDGPIPPKYQEIFDVACAARDRAVALVTDRLAAGEPLYGFEVDRACRQVIETQGYGPAFVHRTGHSIGEQVHGNGAHIDDLETRDRRELIPGLLFSIEPGIYLAEEAGLGVRTEIDVFIGFDRKPQIYGPIQRELVRVK
jgi:Xaa-Pro aminopeptidase